MLEHHRQALDNERRHTAEQVAAAKRAQADAQSAAASSAREGAASQLRETQALLTAAEHTIVELQQALEENRTIAHTRCVQGFMRRVCGGWGLDCVCWGDVTCRLGSVKLPST